MGTKNKHIQPQKPDPTPCEHGISYPDLCCSICHPELVRYDPDATPESQRKPAKPKPRVLNPASRETLEECGAPKSSPLAAAVPNWAGGSVRLPGLTQLNSKIVSLRLLGQMQFAEIAEKTGLTENAVKLRYKRAVGGKDREHIKMHLVLKALKEQEKREQKKQRWEAKYIDNPETGYDIPAVLHHQKVTLQDIKRERYRKPRTWRRVGY